MGLTGLFLAWPSPGWAASVAPNEAQLKATFLFQFVRFVEWPPKAFADDKAPITIGVLGNDPIEGYLEKILRGELAHGRPLVLRHLESEEAARTCQVLFISPSEKNRLNQVLASLKKSHVLTVSDLEDFAAMGGMINFRKENEALRFEINVTAAERAELKIHSRLLNLAKIVRHNKEVN